MESKVRVGEEEEEKGERQKVERLVEKLKNYTKSNNGPSTPVHVSFSCSSKLSSPSDLVSSRKLAAAFWEFHRYYYEEEDHRFFSSPPAAAKMHRRQRHGKAVVKENGLDLSQFLRDPSPDHQPESAGSLRRQIGQVLMKHHQSLERNNHALQPVSPASYGSSLEVAPYNNKAVTPSSSMDFQGRPSREPHYNLKTSTELLKVLNRIWTLEEQHASNISLIKSLKTELAHSRLRIKELLRYQQADRHELNGVVKQLAEENLSRKNKELERIQTVRKELEDERKLRKRSESMQRKLGREISEVKLSLSECVKEIERGNKSKKMAEMLCDEFAKGIKSYGLKHKSLDKDGEVERDQMVLHVAESWLDERMQGGGDSSVLDKLGVEIETFLQAKRRSSLESVPFNALSAPPHDVECEEDSGGSDSNCFELKKPVEESHVNQTNQDDEKPFQVKFEDQMAWAMSSNGKKKTQTIKEEDDDEKNSGNKPENEATNKNDVMGEMIRTHRRLLSETGEASCSSYPPSWRQASPVRQWTSRTVTSELSAKPDVIGIAQGVKDNTLKTKLAKSSKSRLRLFKG